MKLSKTETNFLQYEYKGNGKYRIARYGSKAYSQTNFLKFKTKYPEMLVILEVGNDAPRGGQVGQYNMVQFTESFHKKYSDYLQSIGK